MAYFLLKRDGTRFEGYRTFPKPSTLVFSVTGAEACKAALRMMGICTPIQNYFFDNPHGSHNYNVTDDASSPYLGFDANEGYYGGDKEKDYFRAIHKAKSV